MPGAGVDTVQGLGRAAAVRRCSRPALPSLHRRQAAAPPLWLVLVPHTARPYLVIESTDMKGGVS